MSASIARTYRAIVLKGDAEPVVFARLSEEQADRLEEIVNQAAGYDHEFELE
ncbi:hypothetical protein [Streptomyces sp. NBC_01506]|uniref:hypothetical protein n=1 Tax=Streptomyces sp. NBC_01506 TaxID=2903887 RepID=UPI00386B1706